MIIVPLVGIEPTWTATVSTPYKSEPIQGRERPKPIFDPVSVALDLSFDVSRPFRAKERNSTSGYCSIKFVVICSI